MNSIEPTATHILKIWWFLIWRGALLGALAGALIGFILGVVFAVTGVHPERAQSFFMIAGYIAGTAAIALVVAMLLKKSFSDFRVVLVPLNETGIKEQ